MTYDDDHFARFERERERQESRKINIALWPEQMSPNIELQPDCEYCHVVLKPSPKPPGSGKMWCPDCGNEYGKVTPKPKPKPKKFKPKQSGTPQLIVQSQSKRRKRRGLGLDGIEAEDVGELRKDLAAMGIIDAATVDEYYRRCKTRG